MEMFFRAVSPTAQDEIERGVKTDPEASNLDSSLIRPEEQEMPRRKTKQ